MAGRHQKEYVLRHRPTRYEPQFRLKWTICKVWFPKVDDRLAGNQVASQLQITPKEHSNLLGALACGNSLTVKWQNVYRLHGNAFFGRNL